MSDWHEIDALAAVIHDAKIRECWHKSKWDERRAKEPWGDHKRHAGTPNQPWHDIAIAQAKAALNYMENVLVKP